jgi:hypothetical protein
MIGVNHQCLAVFFHTTTHESIIISKQKVYLENILKKKKNHLGDMDGVIYKVK